MCGVKYGQCVRLIKFKMDLITVIIPCYNSGKTLQRAVDSVLNQTFEKIELIIINDGSNDTKTIKILKTIKDAIIINQKNSGLASARNRGFREAKGNYLVFLDADDWLSKNAISYMLKAIKKSSSKYVLCSSLLEGDREGIYSRHYNFFEQLFINHVHYFMLIEKNTFSKIGGYDENMKLGYEDWEFSLRLLKNGIKARKVNKTLFHYHVSNHGMLNSISKKNHANIYNYIKTKHKDLYKVKKIISLYLQNKKKKMNYHFFVYMIIFISSLILPKYFYTKVYNFFYKIKSFIS